MKQLFAFLIVIWLPLTIHAVSINSMTLGDEFVNSYTTYTWVLSTNNTTPYTNTTLVSLLLPSLITIPANYSVTVNGIAPTSLNLSGSYRIQFNMPSTIVGNGSSITIIVSNVRNPGYSTLITSGIGIQIGSQSASFTNFIYITPGQLASCEWVFAGNTQESNSNLQIIIITKNELLSSVAKKIQANYPTYSNNKPLAQSPLCSITYLNVTISTSCSISGSTLTATFTPATTIPPSTNLSINVLSANNPLTAQTQGTGYTITTYYDNTVNIKKVDESGSICTVRDIGVSTYTSQSIAATVNSLSIFPQLNINATSSSTYLANDILQLSTPQQLSNCTGNIVLTNSNTALFFKLESISNNIRYFKNNASRTSIIITKVSIECSVKMPPSSIPSSMTLTFKRSSSSYLIIHAPLVPTIDTLLNATLSVSTQQMLSSATYTFTIINRHPLTSSPSISITTTNSSINLTLLSTCSATINAISTNCTIQTNNTIYINITANNSINSSSTIIIALPSIINPSSPGNKIFTIKTIYNSSLPAGQVEMNSNIILSPTARIISNADITPSTFQVYQNTQFTIRYVNDLSLLPGSTYFFQFPNTLLSVSFQSLLVNNSTISTLSTPSSATNNNVTTTYTNSVTASTQLRFVFNAQMPPYIIPTSPIYITISNSNTIYETASVAISVSILSPATFSISPLYQLSTGVFTKYSFLFTTTVAHPSQFQIQVTYPSTIAYQHLSAISEIDSANKSLPITPNGNNITATLVNANSSQFSYTLVLGNFQNRRSVGTTDLFYFKTYTLNGSQITSGNATATISQPSTISARLSTQDTYYRNNTNILNIQLYSLTNSLTTSDKIYLTIPSDIFTVFNSVSCTGCVFSNTSTETTIIVTNRTGQSINVSIAGLISNPNTLFGQTKSFKVETKTLTAEPIDIGFISYSISCNNANPVYQCKQCTANGTCLSCYSADNRYLVSGQCVSDCGSETSYKQFNTVNATCIPCQLPCDTCYNANACRSCINSSIQYYLYSNQTCIQACQTINGYYIESINGVAVCLTCADPNCRTCENGSNDGCSFCKAGFNMQNGLCQSGCIGNFYADANGVCTACDVSCLLCIGPSNQQCKSCNVFGGYKNNSGQCVNGCPAGTVAIGSTGSCGCDTTKCQTCQTIQTYCLICSNNSLVAYGGECYGNCPNGTYKSGVNCIDCITGCNNCTSTTCFECYSNYYSFNNSCYTDCNIISQQYDVNGNKCVQCPTGCDTCSSTLCYSCLDSYFHVVENKTCIQACLLTNTCSTPSVIPSKILPLPGTITIVGWVIVVAIVKLIVTKLYFPYSYLYGGVLIQLILEFALIGNLSSLTAKQRLLAMAFSNSRTVLGLLIGGLVLNYVMNLAYVFIFCKYIKKLVSQRQVDIITNYLVVIIATLTSYRFALLSYSRMFPKPHIHIDNAAKLTPVHYLCIISLLLSVLSLSAAGITIYNDYALTDCFMLGVDLLIVSALNALFSIWIVSVNKSDEYYDGDIKKYTLEDNFKSTQENIVNSTVKEDNHNISNAIMNANQQNANQQQTIPYNHQSNIPYNKLNYITDSEINYPISKPVQINPVSIIVNNSKDSDFPDDLSLRQNSLIQTNLNTKQKEYPNDFSKHKSPKNINSQRNFKKQRTNRQLKKKQIDDSEVDYQKNAQFYQDKQIEDVILARPKKHQTSAIIKIDKPQVTMKKKNRISYIQSETGAADLDQVNLQEIIKKRKKVQINENKTGEKKQQTNSVQLEDISPSWFDVQNQRLDFTDFDSNI